MEKHRCYGCMAMIEEDRCPHCGYSSAGQNEPHQLPVGTVLRNQYLVGRVLGQGGFGITYLGWDRGLALPIAIKEFYPGTLVYRDHTQNLTVQAITRGAEAHFAASRTRFLREAQALGMLRDIPQIVNIYSCFQENGTAYIIMEYVQGRELKDYVAMKGGKLTVEETLRLLEPVFDALAQVHSRDMVHRDISPDNILLHPKVGAKLLDFGAVREVENAEAGQDLTHSTEAVIKRGFAPPEQYRSRGGIGPWTDEYALCATVYYCLTGKVPPEAVARALYNEHPDWASIPGLSRKQRAALEKGMSLAPQERYADVRTLKENLYPRESAPQPEPEPVPQPSEETRPSPAPAPKAAPKSEPKPAPAAAPKSVRKNNAAIWVLPALIGTVLLAVVALILVLTVKPAGKKPVPELQTPDIPVLEIAEESTTGTTEEPTNVTTEEPQISEEPWKENVLCRNPFWKLYNIFCNEMTEVHFLDSTLSAPANAIDVSNDHSRSVLMWNDGTKVYVAADGGINAVECCEDLFNFDDYSTSSLKKVVFGNAFHTDYATTMWNMFYYCDQLTDVDLVGLNTSNVTDMDSMFAGCSNLTDIDVSGFDTSNVISMGGMFAGCSNLTEIDVSGFDTSNVIYIGSMFAGCSNLTDIDVSGFDTSNVTSMENMFWGCRNLTEIDVSGFDTSNVENMSFMFYSTSDSLQIIGLDKLDLSLVVMYENFLPEGRRLPNRQFWEILFH